MRAHGSGFQRHAALPYLPLHCSRRMQNLALSQSGLGILPATYLILSEMLHRVIFARNYSSAFPEIHQRLHANIDIDEIAFLFQIGIGNQIMCSVGCSTHPRNKLTRSYNALKLPLQSQQTWRLVRMRPPARTSQGFPVQSVAPSHSAVE